MDNSIVKYTLGYLKKEGASVKKIINKCYKILANDPSLLIENVNVLKKYNVDIDVFFGDKNANYSMLKVKGLGRLIDKMIEKRGIQVTNDIDLMNKCMLDFLKKGEL